MGKRLAKSELLEQIQLERGKLEETLAALTKKQMTTSGVTDTGWAVKDVLTHLILSITHKSVFGDFMWPATPIYGSFASQNAVCGGPKKMWVIDST